MPGTGPVVGGRCQVCRSQRRYDAEEFVHQGMAVSQAARAVGVTRRSLSNHMQNHAAPRDDAPAGAKAEPVEGPADKVLDAIGDQLARMLAGKLSTTQRLAVLSEQRRLAESRARVVGPSQDAVRVADVDGLGELIAEWHEALKDFPGAREKLRELYRARTAAAAN